MSNHKVHTMKTYKKIDLYFMGDYLCSTNGSRTCKEARRVYLQQLADRFHGLGGLTTLEQFILKHPKEVKARFSKS